MVAAVQNNKWIIPVGICIFLTLFGIQEYRLRSIETKIALLTASMERGSVEEKYSTARTKTLEIGMESLRTEVQTIRERLTKIDSNVETVLRELRNERPVRGDP